MTGIKENARESTGIENWRCMYGPTYGWMKKTKKKKTKIYTYTRSNCYEMDLKYLSGLSSLWIFVFLIFPYKIITINWIPCNDCRISHFP